MSKDLKLAISEGYFNEEDYEEIKDSLVRYFNWYFRGYDNVRLVNRIITYKGNWYDLHEYLVLKGIGELIDDIWDMLEGY